MHTCRTHTHKHTNHQMPYSRRPRDRSPNCRQYTNKPQLTAVTMRILVHLGRRLVFFVCDAYTVFTRVILHQSKYFPQLSRSALLLGKLCELQKVTHVTLCLPFGVLSWIQLAWATRRPPRTDTAIPGIQNLKKNTSSDQGALGSGRPQWEEYPPEHWGVLRVQYSA